MKKRRTFDIDLPEASPEGFPAGKDVAGGRRSPMAAAIAENADSLRERRAIEAEIRAENDALAAEHVRMKQLGLIVDLIPLDQIETWKLTRDRRKGDDAELEELVASVRDIGLSNPVRVERRADGKYELIQGYRRLTAYRQLLDETGDVERWGQIPAGISAQGEELEHLYRRMVDENLVRKDISFAEMATLALNYARDPGTAETDPDRAVAELFQSAGYQKRSYIRQFIKLISRLGDDLRFAQHIPRALGLKLATALEQRPELIQELREELRGREHWTVAEEMELLRSAVGQGGDEDSSVDMARNEVRSKSVGRAKTTFQIHSKLGAARCTASIGRLEIKIDRDFSALDRHLLETAVKRLLDDLI